MHRLFAVTAIMLVCPAAFALEIPQNVQRQFLSQGGNAKALGHVNCFLRTYERALFELKPTPPEDRDTFWQERCSNFAIGENKLTAQNARYVVIVDYTKPSDEQRFYLLSLDNESEPAVTGYFVSHGRYRNTPARNTRPGRGRNTVRWLKYYSNTRNWNASTSGFYLSGSTYLGQYSGPDRDIPSLLLHGLERGVNDNTCRRAVVVHGNSYIRENGKLRGVRKMSSGCYMLDYAVMKDVVSKIRGPGGDLHENEYKNGGVIFFTYGSRERSLPANHYCQRRENIPVAAY